MYRNYYTYEFYKYYKYTPRNIRTLAYNVHNMVYNEHRRLHMCNTLCIVICNVGVQCTAYTVHHHYIYTT